MKTQAFDIIVIGGGPSGSTSATLLAQKGYNVALFEKLEFPRFRIGESLLPASMPVLRKTGALKRIESGNYLIKHGARFMDYRSGGEEIRFSFADGLNPEISYAYEVQRQKFDADLMEHARDSGVRIFQPEEILKIENHGDSVEVSSASGTYTAKYVVDASGKASSLLGNAFHVNKVGRDNGRIGIFSHFKNVARRPGPEEGDILIAMLPNNAWSWVIPFKGETTSIGVVCKTEEFKEFTSAEECFHAKLKISTKLFDLCKEATRQEELRVLSNYAHKFEKFFGDRWLLLGDAAAFIDPVFSSGVHIGLHSSTLACDALDTCIKSGENLTSSGEGEKYQLETEKGMRRFSNLIDLFYQSDFVPQMKTTLRMKLMQQAFTSAVAGDMWNEENFLFEKAVL